MNTIPGSQFRDCSNGDFEHYFLKTILLWNLSPTKKRLFICEGLSGDVISGQYLTRQREFKPKNFNLGTWWQNLDVLPPYGATFNLGQCAAMWYPSMAKYLKKSFPTLENTAQGSFVILGSPKAGEITVQNVMASAFHKHYSSMSLPDLKDALDIPNCSAVAANGNFAVNFHESKLYLKNSVMGTIRKASREVVVLEDLAKEILVDMGHVPPDRIVVQK